MASKKKLEKLYREYLGETVHTAFRKGSDGRGAGKVWTAIAAMPDDEWSDALDWMAWALAESTHDKAPIRRG